jgi:hypothetical protein
MAAEFNSPVTQRLQGQGDAEGLLLAPGVPHRHCRQFATRLRRLVSQEMFWPPLARSAPKISYRSRVDLRYRIGAIVEVAIDEPADGARVYPPFERTVKAGPALHIRLIIAVQHDDG